MTALIRMRLSTYLRTQVSFAPPLAAIAVRSILYGGGRALTANLGRVIRVLLADPPGSGTDPRP